MAQPKTGATFQEPLQSNYYSLRLDRSCIAANSIIRPFEEAVDSEKLKSTSEKSGISTVKVSTKLKAIYISIFKLYLV
jgi:hypothetical protein